MRAPSYDKICTSIAALPSGEAALVLKRFLTNKGKEYVEDVLKELHSYNTREWWLDVMCGAGEEVANLYHGSDK